MRPGYASETICQLHRRSTDVKDMLKPAATGKENRFLSGDLEHASSIRYGAMTEGNDERAIGREKRCHVRHRDLAFLVIEVHPDCGQHDESEAPSTAADGCQVRQAVVNPFD